MLTLLHWSIWKCHLSNICQTFQVLHGLKSSAHVGDTNMHHLHITADYASIATTVCALKTFMTQSNKRLFV